MEWMISGMLECGSFIISVFFNTPGLSLGSLQRTLPRVVKFWQHAHTGHLIILYIVLNSVVKHLEPEKVTQFGLYLDKIDIFRLVYVYLAG